MRSLIRIKSLLRAAANLIYAGRDKLLSFFFGKRLHQILPSAIFSNDKQNRRKAAKQSIRNDSVLILIPCKNISRFIPALITNLLNLNYPPDLIDLAFLEGDGSDDSHTQLQKQLAKLKQHFHSALLLKKNFGSTHPTVKRWQTKHQRERRATIARVRNHLLKSCLTQKHKWVLWIDGDVTSWSPDILSQLLAYKRDIIVPHCIDENGKTFDLNTFIYDDKGKKNWRTYIKDDLLQPPLGYGRKYLSDFPHYELVALDSVGGTMLLVNAEVHHKGVIFPTEPFHHHIETEAFAFLARSYGYSCWGAPQLSIIHPRY